MPTHILGLGTASPAHRMTQAEALQMFTDIVCEDQRQVRLGRALFRKAEVHTRGTVLPHRIAYNWCSTLAGTVEPSPRDIVSLPRDVVSSPCDESTSHDESTLRDRTQLRGELPTVLPGKSHGPSTGERMQLYSEFAGELACESSRKALDQARIAPYEITHLVTVSCTGFDAPGVDIHLIKRLGLPNTTQRLHIGFMGCHGAINGLRAARAITEADANARVLLCAVELCSLHYRFTWDSEAIIGNALFGDGSAALVLSGGPQAVPTSALPWQVVDTGSVVIAESNQSMSWSIGDHGFDMRLSSDIGDKIESCLAGWLTAWLAKHQLSVDDISYWGVHPGGPKIVAAVKNCLSLSDEDLRTSRAILAKHGNMSSPTVLFILNEFQRARAAANELTAGHCVLLGFGPGLVAEVALLSVPQRAATIN